MLRENLKFMKDLALSKSNGGCVRQPLLFFRKNYTVFNGKISIYPGIKRKENTMGNNDIIMDTMIREIKGIGFNEGFENGRKTGFTRGVIVSVLGYTIYKWCRWLQKEYEEFTIDNE